MTVAWICSLLLISGFYIKGETKIETFYRIAVLFGYLSFLTYLTYLTYIK